MRRTSMSITARAGRLREAGREQAGVMNERPNPVDEPARPEDEPPPSSDPAPEPKVEATAKEEAPAEPVEKAAAAEPKKTETKSPISVKRSRLIGMVWALGPSAMRTSTRKSSMAG